MRYEMEQDRANPVICLGDEVTYGQRPEWSDATWRPLKLSLMRFRQWFDYDPHRKMPVIVWICGGAFTHADKNVWVPEMAYYARRGFIVASVDYSTVARTTWPMQIEDIKLAIRWLRAHAEQFHIDKERFVIMGESAGAYLAAAVGLLGREYDKGEYLEESSAVRGVISLYGVFGEVRMDNDRLRMPSLYAYVTPDVPPFMLLHGTDDQMVSKEGSEKLYALLQENGVRSDLYIIKGAHHADSPFYQPEIKDKILRFIHEAID